MGLGGWPSRQGPIAPSRKVFSRGTTVSQQNPDIVDTSIENAPIGDGGKIFFSSFFKRLIGLFRTAVANTIEAPEPLDLICQNREQQKTRPKNEAASPAALR